MRPDLPEQALKLSVDERIRLAQDICDSAVDEMPNHPLDDDQHAELLRRAADARKSPGIGKPWAEVKARLPAGA
jgi:putative addiction module component (TIGR02574 family)